MKNLVTYTICFFLALPPLFAELFLKEQLSKAKSGDYIVFETGKIATVLAIRDLSPTTILFEEISCPLTKPLTQTSSWADWIKNKAPGHTSWSMIEIDLRDGQILESYSFSRNGWIQISQQESLIATLLQLPLKAIALDKQRKIGPPPLDNEPDFRKVWYPPLIFEGTKLERASFDVFETTWPKDESELSGQTVILYFDKEKRFPLPFWIQVDTSHVSASMRAIDSGKNLPVVYRSIPRRVPEFLGTTQRTGQGLVLSLKTPKYYRQFELFAVDVTSKEKQIYPISHSLKEKGGDFFNVEIAFEELKETLKPNHSYTWLLVPIGHSESYTESYKPFVWIEKN